MRAPLDLTGSAKHAMLRLLPWVETAWATHRASGLQFLVSPRDVVGRTIMRRQSYEPDLTDWLLETLRGGPEGLFIDVGANLGWFTLQAARLPQVQRVLAIEPDAGNHRLLQANIERNGLGAGIDAVACAAGPKSDLARLHRYKGSNLGRHSLLADHGQGGTWVPVESLDGLLHKLGMAGRPIAAIKIDVEGYEPLVLRGASGALGQARALLVEVSPELSRSGGLRAGEVLDVVGAAGFLPRIWDRGGAVPDFEGLRAYPGQATIGFSRA